MNASGQPKSANFNFLAKRYPDLERIGAVSERYFSDDPVVALIMLRQFGELLAQTLAARSGLLTDARELQADLLRRLRVDGNYPPTVMDLFHQLRKLGNAATHNREGDHATALSCLKMARQLAIWVYRTFDDQNFKPGPFQPPRPPADATAELTAQLDRLRAEKDAALSEAERAKALVAEAEAARLAAEKGAQGAAEEKAVWEQLASEAEASKSQLALQIAILQGQVAFSISKEDYLQARLRQPSDAEKLAEQLLDWQSAAVTSSQAEKQTVLQFAEAAAEAIDLDEADTRQLIDEQLRERGWDADTVNLRYAKGARPVKGKSMAIAEWPTAMAKPPALPMPWIGGGGRTTMRASVMAAKSRLNCWNSESRSYHHGAGSPGQFTGGRSTRLFGRRW